MADFTDFLHTAEVPQMGMPSTQHVSVASLESFCIEAFVSVGMTPEHAKMSAEVLVATDLWGIYSHGSYRLQEYVDKIRAGGLDARAVPEVTAEGPGWVMVDGHDAHAMVSATIAMRLAIEKAKLVGIGFAGVKNAYHFGAAGYYANLAAQRDLIGLAMSNNAPSMTAPGARSHVIGNNPFAYAVPAGEEDPILLDIAMSAAAGTKVQIAKASGVPVPDGWMVDERGLPTTDSAKFPHSMSLLPFAGHKGYGLALMVEVLAATLTGAGVTWDVIGRGTGMPDKRNSGHAFIAINVETMMPVDQFKRRMDRMIRHIRESPKADGADRIYLPGEMEWKRRAAALEHGIPLPSISIDALRATGDLLGLNAVLEYR